MKTFGFIGAGWMGGAIIGGFSKFATDVQCCYFDVSPERCREMEEKYGVAVEPGNDVVIIQSDYIVITVLPQIYERVREEIAANYREGQVIISPMAGISLDYLAAGLPAGAKICRMMPNMALEIGAGTSLFSFNDQCSAAEKEELLSTFSALGLAKEIPENLMDAATSLAGCTPGFFYTMIDAMMLGGVKIGFSRSDAEEIAVWSMLGAAQLLRETGGTASYLRDQMMAPSGSTNAGICALEKNNFRGTVISAVEASLQRTKEFMENID